MIYEQRQTLSHSKSADAYLEYCKTDYWPKLKSEGGQPLCLLSGLEFRLMEVLLSRKTQRDLFERLW